MLQNLKNINDKTISHRSEEVVDEQLKQKCPHWEGIFNVQFD